MCGSVNRFKKMKMKDRKEQKSVNWTRLLVFNTVFMYICFQTVWLLIIDKCPGSKNASKNGGKRMC